MPNRFVSTIVKHPVHPPFSSVMHRCIFMRIQLHLATLVKCETRFMRLGSYRPSYDVNFGQRKIVTLLSGHPHGDTQLLELRTVSFTNTKRRGVSVKVYKWKQHFYLNIRLARLTVLCFSRMNGFGLSRAGLTIGQTRQIAGDLRFWVPRAWISKHSFTGFSQC